MLAVLLLVRIDLCLDVLRPTLESASRGMSFIAALIRISVAMHSVFSPGHVRPTRNILYAFALAFELMVTSLSWNVAQSRAVK